MKGVKELLKAAYNCIVNFAKDKLLHLWLITLFVAVAFTLFAWLPATISDTLVFVMIVAIATAKELYDKFKKKSIFCWKDFLYTCIGGLLTLILMRIAAIFT